MAKMLKQIMLQLESSDEGVSYQLNACSCICDSSDEFLVKSVRIEVPADSVLEQKIKDVCAALAAKAKADESIS